MKYKYYLKKPRAEIVKDILSWLAIGTAILVASTSPYFGVNLVRALRRMKKRQYNKQKVYSTFWRLKKQGCIKIEKKTNRFTFL